MSHGGGIQTHVSLCTEVVTNKSYCSGAQILTEIQRTSKHVISGDVKRLERDLVVVVDNLNWLVRTFG